MNKKLLIAIIAVILIAGTVFALQAFRDNPTTEQNTTDQQTEPDPSSDEGSFRESQKEETKQDEEPSKTPASSKETVTVNISQAEYDKANSIVHVKAFANTLEDGTCTLTFTKSGQSTLTYTEETEMQTSYVSCNPFDIPRSDFPTGGSWLARVVFESSTYRGEASQEIQL